MTLRITLLVLVTGLFAMIWTQDQSASNRPLPVADRQETYPPAIAEKPLAPIDATSQNGSGDEMPSGPVMAPVLQQWAQEWSRQMVRWSRWLEQAELRVTESEPVGEALAEIPMDDLWMFGGLEMPLPAEIVPGEYRIVSSTGVVRNVILTLEDLETYHQSQPAYVTRDIYQTQNDTGRWYFIRVQSNSVVAPVIAERGKHKTRPAIAERDEA